MPSARNSPNATFPRCPRSRNSSSSTASGTTRLELSQYISFALTAGGPPDFRHQACATSISRRMCSSMHGLSPLLAAFYKEADIEDLWKRSQRAIDQYIGALPRRRLPMPCCRSTLTCGSRPPGSSGRRFQIFIELLAAPNQIQTRSYGNEYTIVITPSPEPRIFDVRHAYLHYLLDPLATRYQEILDRKKVAGRPRAARPRAARFVQTGLSAADHRIADQGRGGAPGPQAGVVQEALHEGYILTPFSPNSCRSTKSRSSPCWSTTRIGGGHRPDEGGRAAVGGGVQQGGRRGARAVKTAAATAAAAAHRRGQDPGRCRAALPAQATWTRPRSSFSSVLQQTDQKPHARRGLLRPGAHRGAQKDPETSRDSCFEKLWSWSPSRR